ncbi:DUF885 domain-containing protein [Vallitalea okinawensis]|uniref:DUF885 domain-containing protein n=1 Tax=Vallitalea okinawensis TaxID=2078660 RepID=UPI000CFBFB18|nr:DUF885 domain-containing protein [Vallitalea okinawensis]
MKRFKLTALSLIMVIVTLCISGCGNDRSESIKETFNQVAEDHILNYPGETSYTGDLQSLGIEAENYDIPYVSDEQKLKQIDSYKKNLILLSEYDNEELNTVATLNNDAIKWFLQNQIDSEEFMYNKHKINQLWGIQVKLPDYLTNQFQINNKEDAELYISLLEQSGRVFDQLIEDSQVREEKGIIPSKYTVNSVKRQCREFALGRAINNEIYTSYVKKVEVLDSISEEEKEELYTLVEEGIKEHVFPAYQRLIDYTEELSLKASNKPSGVWDLPNDDEYYQYLLRTHTTTDLTPEEIHNLGLSEVERIKLEIEKVLQETEYKDLKIPECFDIPSEVYSGDEALAKYEQLIREMDERLPEMFDIFPEDEIVIKPVPAYRQDSISNYYSIPAIDLSTPGTYYVNLGYDHWENSMLPLAYHEGLPGHHFQLTIQVENEDIPVIRKVWYPTAYTEGWALYAEKLADEYGLYETPVQRLGYLQSELLRAGRLVVDTGLHYKRWSRDEAIDYLNGLTGWDTSREIDRYLIYPGQACSYKIGELKILELREKAKTELGNDFDIKEFHRVILENGAMPLDILEQHVCNYIESN